MLDDWSDLDRLSIAAVLSRLYYPGVNPMLTTANPFYIPGQTARSRRADPGPALARTLRPCPKTFP
ncbi:MAG TPA: hypothetical protein VHG31_04155, partial [Stellaceae bacterium]|nr:hypothetical protein [Stellaceae bacterium]